jgi:hypothetical protein
MVPWWVFISLGECDNPLPGLYARVSAADEFIRDGICELSDVPPAFCNGRKASGVCNTCAGRWIRIGTQTHRKVLGDCFEICSTVTLVFGDSWDTSADLARESFL